MRYSYYTLVEFEYDLEKSAANQSKHGIDFKTAQALWQDENRVLFNTIFTDESRSGLIALFQNKLWCAIYTIRKERLRIISVRRARKYEENLYYQSR